MTTVRHAIPKGLEVIFLVLVSSALYGCAADVDRGDDTDPEEGSIGEAQQEDVTCRTYTSPVYTRQGNCEISTYFQIVDRCQLFCAQPAGCTLASVPAFCGIPSPGKESFFFTCNCTSP
jgi:hypothetical protein